MRWQWLAGVYPYFHSMAHAEGWIELYTQLENGLVPRPELVTLCKGNRSGLGETMLHWYCIEGSPNVVQKLITLGFSIDVQNEFGNTPLMEAATIDRWNIVRILLKHRASIKLLNNFGNDFRKHLKEYNKRVPIEIRFRIWLRIFGL